jgi:hypothetical protein
LIVITGCTEVVTFMVTAFDVAEGCVAQG